MAVEKGNGKRRLWELQSYTISRILGLCFDEKALRRLVKDLKLDYGIHDPALPKLYQHLAQICQTPNPQAKQVEKILEKQFGTYKKEAAALDPQEICEFIENGTNAKISIPIAALIWFATRKVNIRQTGAGGNSKAGEIEARISTAVQLREYQALRFYDGFIRKLPENVGKAEHIIKALDDATDSNRKLQRRCDRREQKQEELISERDKLKTDKLELVHELEEQKRLLERLVRRIEELGGESAFEQLNAMRGEMEFLREEIKRLNRENADLIKLYTSESEFNIKEGLKTAMIAGSTCNYNDNPTGEVNSPQLNDMRVAYVGGVESLESCYNQLAQSFGCPFCYHGGHCERGKREIERLVERNDVICCPVDINSHNACRMVKEACKLRNKPCYFLRSSGLSAFKKCLLNLAAEF